MMLQYFLPQMSTVQMDIDFGSGYILMPEHHLYGSQVGSAFQKMGGKTMAECVRTDVLAHPREFGVFFDVDKETYPA